MINLKTIKNLAVTLIAGFIAFGCSNKNNSTQISDDGPYEVENVGSDIIEKILSDTKLNCLDDKCNPSVGLLGVLETQRNKSQKDKTYGMKTCTGWLIADNMVATSKHCFTRHALRSGSNCGKLVGIHFPSTEKYKKEIKTCKKIISTSQSPDDFPFDYVVFEIDKSEHPELEISLEGLKNHTSVVIEGFAPKNQDGDLVAEYMSEECKLAMGTQLLLDFSSSFSPNGLAIGCKTRKGHSGSPVFVKNGEGKRVVGILKGKSMRQESWGQFLDEIKKRFLKIELTDDQKKFKEHAMFNNLACIAVPDLVVPNPQCFGKVNKIEEKIIQERPIKNILEDEIQSWTSRTSKYIIFQVKEEIKPESLIYRSTPKCYLSKTKWSEQFKLIEEKEGEKLYEAEFSTKIKMRKIDGLNEDFKVLEDIIRSDFETEVLRFSEPQKGKMKVYSGKDWQNKIEIEPCQKVDLKQDKNEQ